MYDIKKKIEGGSDTDTDVKKNLRIYADKKLQLRDTGIFLQSGTDGKLTISADGTSTDDITLAGTVSISDDLVMAEDKDISMSGTATFTTGTGTIAINGATAFAEKITPKAHDGAASASGLMMGIGTSVTPATTSTADAIFMEFRTQNTATSGDSRCLYIRHDINGAGAGGESLRTFSKVTAAASTVRGAHISIDLSTTGSVSGFGAGVDAQVLYGNTSYSSTLTAINAELYADGSSTAITAGTGSFLRCSVGGNATGVTDIVSNAAFISFTNAASAGGIVNSSITALTGKAGLRVYVAGTLYGYIPIVTGA